MKTTILGLLAETFIHPGAGQTSGLVDLPVAREVPTDYPVIPGSSLKGALLDKARSEGMDENTRNQVFGEQNAAGNILVSDLRILLLPVRSLTSQYKWVTCRHILERFQRDTQRCGILTCPFPLPEVTPKHYLGNSGRTLFLEERQFSHQNGLPRELLHPIGQLVPHHQTVKRLAKQLVVLNDDDFAWFARYGLAVNARNVLHEERKTSENLWYEETIPPDSLFYAILAQRGGNAICQLTNILKKRPYLQAGGNETIGQGWFAVKILEQQSDDNGDDQ